jgi:hypothetical protein
MRSSVRHYPDTDIIIHIGPGHSMVRFWAVALDRVKSVDGFMSSVA